MNRTTCTFGLGVAVFLQMGTVWAQDKSSPGSIARPNVSPYLGLLNRGASPAINYYTNVLPQQQAVQAFNRQDQINQELYNQDTSQGTIATGHRSAFLNHQRYFMTTSTGFGTSRQGFGQRPPTAGQQQSGGAAQGYGGAYGQPQGRGAGRIR
jgi:hypothetical protein